MSDFVFLVLGILIGIIGTVLVLRFRPDSTFIECEGYSVQDVVDLADGNIITINEARSHIGHEPVIGGDDILLMTPDGPVALSDLDDYFTSFDCDDECIFDALDEADPLGDFEFYIVLEEDNPEYHGVFGASAVLAEAEFAVEQLEMRDRSARIITADGLFTADLLNHELYD